MQHAATFWDKTAEKYAKSPIADLKGYHDTLARTRSYLAPGDQVLEIGCGTGSTALLLAENVRQIVATDISPKMIEIAERKAQAQGIANARFEVADVADATRDGGPYDAVLAFNLVHLLEDAPAAIAAVSAALKPGGLFISKTVCQPGAGAPLKFRLIKVVLPLMQWLGKAPYVNFMAADALDALITSNGFKILETLDQPPSRYIVARKV